MSLYLKTLLDDQRRQQADEADAKNRAALHYPAQAALAAKPRHPAQVAGWLARIPAENLLHEAQALARELALLQGFGHTPQSGCTLRHLTLDDAEVVVEFEHEPEDGDGWNEPHHAATTTAIQVLVNGCWIPTDLFAPEVIERWEQAAIDALADDVQNDADDRAEAAWQARQA